MNRTQLACFALTASAFILAAMLVVRLGDLNTAQAALVTQGDDYVFLTAATGGQESLFVLDKNAHMLIVYETEIRGRRGKLVPKNFYSLTTLLELDNLGGAEDMGGGGRVPR